MRRHVEAIAVRESSACDAEIEELPRRNASAIGISNAFSALPPFKTKAGEFIGQLALAALRSIERLPIAPCTIAPLACADQSAVPRASAARLPPLMAPLCHPKVASREGIPLVL